MRRNTAKNTNLFEKRRMFEKNEIKNYNSRKEFMPGNGVFTLIEVRDFSTAVSSRYRNSKKESSTGAVEDDSRISPFKGRQPEGTAKKKSNFNSILSFFGGTKQKVTSAFTAAGETKNFQMKVKPDLTDRSVLQTETNTLTNQTRGKW